MGRQLKSPLGADVSLNLVKQAQSQPSPPHHKNYGSVSDKRNKFLPLNETFAIRSIKLSIIFNIEVVKLSYNYPQVIENFDKQR